jgi:intracellular sulfur oxidation DsrE/DsrF family protein
MDFKIERILHAYIDGELEPQAKSRLLIQMENNEAIRARACELQRTKEWVKSSFEGETAPTRTLPGIRWRLRHTSPFHIAASLLIAVMAFGAGWSGHSLRDGTPTPVIVQDTANNEAPHVILHISDADESRFVKVLERTEMLLLKYRNTGAQIEVVANSGGLDLMRTASSHHVDRIKLLIARYDNVRFIACSRGLGKLRELGMNTAVIDGVDAHAPAADHLIERLTEGWTYIRI